MADIFEVPESGPVSSPENGAPGSHTRKYRVTGESSSAAAIEGVLALTPLAVELNGLILVRQTIEATPAFTDIWDIDVLYGAEQSTKSIAKPEPGVWRFRFSTGGGSETVKFARMISRHWNNTGPEAPATNAINFDGKEVKGIPVPVGSGRFSITAFYDAREITPGFFKEHADVVGYTNTDVFLGAFQGGEVRYLGCDGEGDIPLVSGQRVAPIAITHDFEFSANDDDVQIDGINMGKDASGNVIATIAKKGWEYLHTRQIVKKDETTQQLNPLPRHVYVSDPHYHMSFSDFFGFGAGG